MNSTVAPRLLDEKGACGVLNVGKHQLKRLRLSRQVPFVRVSRKVIRYRRADLEDFIARARIAAVWESQQTASTGKGGAR